jgi:hypothetical protein
MMLLQEELEHPTQASGVRLRVFERPEGFLVTEERTGTATVFATLGVFESREAAEARVRERVEELARQRYRPARAAA